MGNRKSGKLSPLLAAEPDSCTKADERNQEDKQAQEDV